jgi:hypothetical protein
MKRLLQLLFYSGVTAAGLFCIYCSVKGYMKVNAPRPAIAACAPDECNLVPNAPPTDADFEKWDSNAFVGSPYERYALYYEARLIAQHPNLAHREGRTLTIFSDGKTLATLKPGEPRGQGIEDCVLAKVLRLASTRSSGFMDVPYIICYTGEFDHPFLLLPSGEQWPALSASASPNGRLVATGSSTSVGQDNFDNLTLYAWPSRKPVARFPANCEVIGWRNDTRFNATCIYDPTPNGMGEKTQNDTIPFDAMVWQDDSGTWQMQSVQGDLPRNSAERTTVIHAPPMEPLRKVPRLHFTATVPKDGSGT